jgi:hypothetical protein
MRIRHGRLVDRDTNPSPDPLQRAKPIGVSRGTERAFESGLGHKVRMNFGTHTLFSAAKVRRCGRKLKKPSRFMAPLRMATGAAGELPAPPGARAPCDGRLGAFAEDAFGDLPGVDGDPAACLDWLEDRDNRLRRIVKGDPIHSILEQTP